MTNPTEPGDEGCPTVTTSDRGHNPLAEVLRIAAALADWDSPYGPPLARDLAAAVATEWDADTITEIAEQAGNLADAIVLDYQEDHDLFGELLGYEKRLTALAAQRPADLPRHLALVPACDVA